MTAQELNTYINKVLGNSIRCLLPSYWWKRLLTQIVEYVYEVDVKADTAYNSIRGLLGFTIATGEEGAIVYADNNKVVIPANAIRKVNFLNNFSVMPDKGAGVVAIDTSMASTSTVTSMANMFQECENLTSLDVSSFDTSKVTEMGGMFLGCSSLTSLDLSNFNTSNVETMADMFSCVWTQYSNLVSLDLSSFDTSKVTRMENMFWYCTGLTSLDLSSFDTSRVEYWYRMFDDCNNLTYLTLGEGFFKSRATEIDFSYLLNWNEDSFIGSVVTNSYDRATNGLPTLEVKLHSNVYAYLTDEHKATLTSKGYTVVSVE